MSTAPEKIVLPTRRLDPAQVELLRSLKPGDLPQRVERTPTPIGGAPKASQGDQNQPKKEGDK